MPCTPPPAGGFRPTMQLDTPVDWDRLWPEMDELPSVSARDRAFLRGGARAGARLLADAEAVRATVPSVCQRACYLRDWYRSVECFTTVPRKATRENDSTPLEPTEDAYRPVPRVCPGSG